ncbi:MAG: hypothetical protein JWR33_2615 [Naasia sp.]|jgi:hypothetical protein|uniref:hypothetical protein n=1 Tax=Naasia sp. TaxID=2546198 RepID=UPI00261949AB|nr:hypothetical protein [Naasia sp.]MCU1571874.1 hypothetical protein [Naasia sp.]
MKNVLLLVVGVVLGFAVAHGANRTRPGAALFSDLDGRAREFGRVVAESYRAREAELRSAIAKSEDVVNDRS